MKCNLGRQYFFGILVFCSPFHVLKRRAWVSLLECMESSAKKKREKKRMEVTVNFVHIEQAGQTPCPPVRVIVIAMLEPRCS